MWFHDFLDSVYSCHAVFVNCGSSLSREGGWGCRSELRELHRNRETTWGTVDKCWADAQSSQFLCTITKTDFSSPNWKLHKIFGSMRVMHPSILLVLHVRSPVSYRHHILQTESLVLSSRIVLNGRWHAQREMIRHKFFCSFYQEHPQNPRGL